MSLKIEAQASVRIFRANFNMRTNPWIGRIREDKSKTKINFCRSSSRYDQREEIDFWTQGEQVALYVAKPEMETPLFEVYNPSPKINLVAFHDACREIYEKIPEIAEFLRDLFTKTPHERLNFKATLGGRAVLAAILDVDDWEEEKVSIPF